MKYPIGNDDTVYVYQSEGTGWWTNKVNCKVRGAYMYIEPRYGSLKDCKIMTFEEFKKQYPIETRHIWKRYKKAEYA